MTDDEKYYEMVDAAQKTAAESIALIGTLPDKEFVDHVRAAIATAPYIISRADWLACVRMEIDMRILIGAL